MVKIPKSQFILGILVIIYLFLSIYLFFMQVRFEDDIRLTGITARKNCHGVMVLTGLCTLGLGMMLFRLFRGARTRIIKYVHLVIQTTGMIFLIVGSVCAFKYDFNYGDLTPLSRRNVSWPFEKEPDSNDEYFRLMETISRHISGRTHFVLGYMMLVSIILQFLFGVIILAYMYPKSKLRRNFAPIHDIFGIWIYLGLVCTYLTGVFYLHDQEIECCSATNDDARSSMKYLAPPAYLSSIIVFCAVLSPYFEWDLVGPL